LDSGGEVRVITSLAEPQSNQALPQRHRGHGEYTEKKLRFNKTRDVICYRAGRAAFLCASVVNLYFAALDAGEDSG
jgi:hypothetical protein